MKTIVLDGTPFLFPGAGVGRVTQTLVETMAGLLPEGLRLQLYCRCLRGRPLRFPPAPVTRLRLPKAWEPAMARLRLIERLSPGDLYHATDHYLPMKPPFNAVVTVHDLLFMIRPNPAFPIHRIQRKMVPPFVHACRHVIAISGKTRDDLMTHLGVPAEKISVIPWGVDHAFFSPPPETPFRPDVLPFEAPYFLAVGCNTKRKNTPRLLEAYCASGVHSPLVLAWTPPPEIREQYGREPGIHFIGRVDDRQLRDLYRGALALVYPSLYEGFGLPVLEAMSCGCPVITSNTTSLPEVGGEAARYVDPEDAGRIAEAMSELENRPDLADDLRRRGFSQAAGFSWERAALETLGVYQRVLISRTPSHSVCVL
jgi:alpha-1,3-rhamnosyl/mannosyltransferase